MENTSWTSAWVQVVVVVVVTVSLSEGWAGRRGAQVSVETLTSRLPNLPNAGWSAAVLDRDELLARLQLHKSSKGFFFFFIPVRQKQKKKSTKAASPKITAPTKCGCRLGCWVSVCVATTTTTAATSGHNNNKKKTKGIKQKRCLVTGSKPRAACVHFSAGGVTAAAAEAEPLSHLGANAASPPERLTGRRREVAVTHLLLALTIFITTTGPPTEQDDHRRPPLESLRACAV